MSEPTADTLLARARALVPKLIERAARTAAERRVPDETIADFEAAGFFRVLQPKRYGGLQMEFQVFANLVRELAQGCGSSAWVYAVMAEHGWMFSLFLKDGQDEIWSDHPNARGCAAVDPSGRAEKVDGGYRLTGQWRFVSGSDHAHWAFLTVPAAEGEDFVVVRQLLVRRSELRALDDWHVMGLIGTGSRTLVADNIYVPDCRAITQEEMMLGTAPGGKVHPDYALIRTPRRYLTAFSLSPVLIGLANRALALVMEGTRKKLGTGAALELETMQLRIAESAADLDAANTLLDAHLSEAMARIAAGADIGEREIGRSRMAGAYLARLAYTATAKLCMASGSGWIFNHHPLQKIFRDITAGATHRAMNFETLGKNYVRTLSA